MKVRPQYFTYENLPCIDCKDKLMAASGLYMGPGPRVPGLGKRLMETLPNMPPLSNGQHPISTVDIPASAYPGTPTDTSKIQPGQFINPHDYDKPPEQQSQGPNFGNAAILGLSAFDALLPNRYNRQTVVQPQMAYNPVNYGYGSQAIMQDGGGISPFGNYALQPATKAPATMKIGDRNVDVDTARQIISQAKKNKVNPYEALAIAYQESGIEGNNRAYHLNPNEYGTPFGGAELGIKSIIAQDQYARDLQKRGVIPQGDAYRLQGYNGYGTIRKGHADLEGAGSIYGIPIPEEGINMKKNPLYGKRIIDIMNNTLKSNPQLRDMIDKGDYGYVMGEDENNSPGAKNGKQMKQKKINPGTDLFPFSEDFLPEGKNGNWIQKAVNPAHKGYCTPMTKSTCTPRRKALAKTFKKHHGFHKSEDGGKYGMGNWTETDRNDPMSMITADMDIGGFIAPGWDKYKIGGIIPDNMSVFNPHQYELGGNVNGGAKVRDVDGNYPNTDLMEQWLLYADGGGVPGNRYLRPSLVKDSENRAPFGKGRAKFYNDFRDRDVRYMNDGTVLQPMSMIDLNPASGHSAEIPEPGYSPRNLNNPTNYSATFPQGSGQQSTYFPNQGAWNDFLAANQNLLISSQQGQNRGSAALKNRPMKQGGSVNGDAKIREVDGLFPNSDLMEQWLLYENGGQLSASKAKEMLKDGTANGKKLTKKQKQYFGMVAAGKAAMGMDLPFTGPGSEDPKAKKTTPPKPGEVPTGSQFNWTSRNLQNSQIDRDALLSDRIGEILGNNYDPYKGQGRGILGSLSTRYPEYQQDLGVRIKQLQSDPTYAKMTPEQRITRFYETGATGTTPLDQFIQRGKSLGGNQAAFWQNNASNPYRPGMKNGGDVNGGAKLRDVDAMYPNSDMLEQWLLYRYGGAVPKAASGFTGPEDPKAKRTGPVYGPGYDVNWTARSLQNSGIDQDAYTADQILGLVGNNLDPYTKGKGYLNALRDENLANQIGVRVKQLQGANPNYGSMTPEQRINTLYQSAGTGNTQLDQFLNRTKSLGGSPSAYWQNHPGNPNRAMKNGGIMYDDGGTVDTMWGGTADLESYNPYDGGTIEFNGQSHDNGGIGMHYNGNPIEVEGGEYASRDNEGNLNIYGNMYIPGTRTKFKAAAGAIMNKEKRYNYLKTKGSDLVNESNPANRFDQLRFNAGQVMMNGGQMGLADLASKKEKLSNLQRDMLDMASFHGIDPFEMSKGKMKKAKGGASIPFMANGGSDPGGNDPTRADRNMNPGNIRYGDFAKKYGAKKDKDGFAIFKDRATGEKAMQDLLTSKAYSNMSAKDAIRKWTGGNPYRYDLGPLTDKKISEMNPDELSIVMGTMKQGEGTRYGVAPRPAPGVPNTPRPNVPSPGPYTPYGLPTVNIDKQVPQTTPANPAAPYDQLDVPPDKKLPSDVEPLHFNQLLGEIYAAATNRVEPVPAQRYEPQLFTPYQVSFQDRLNANQAVFNAQSRAVGAGNPAALGTLGAQKYQADSAAMADEFRTNQSIANDITNKNIALVNDANLKNLGIADTQMTRQSQARSKTRELNQMILNSISSKYAQNDLENKRLAAYENLYDYRFVPTEDGGLRATYMGPNAYFNYEGRNSTGQKPQDVRTISRYDSKGNLKGYADYDESDLREQQRLIDIEMKRRKLPLMPVQPLNK